MVNRLLIGAALGAVGATVYQKVKSAPGRSAEQKVTNLADKANAKVDEAQRVVDEKVDVVEKAVGEGVNFLAEAAHKLIGNGQEKATGVSARAKQVATDYAKQAAKEQLTKQASRIFERISTEVKQAAQPAPKTSATPQPTAAEAPIPAMVRLEAERWARDHREEGVLGHIVNDELQAVVFLLKPEAQVNVPAEMLGYKVSGERARFS